MTTNNGALTVNPATLTITANNRSKTYGQAVTFAGTEFITSGLVNSDTVTGASLNSAGALASALASALAAGSPYSIVASAATGTGLTNYSINYVNGSLTVNPALLLVRAESKSRAYGATNPVFTANYSGFVNGESNNVLSGSPAFNTVADVNSPVGSYPIEITQGTLANGNYGFNFTNGNLTVTPYALTVTVNSTNRAYGDANPSLTGIVIGARDGDNITATFTTVANAASTVGTYGITPVISDPNGKLASYSVTTNNGALTVNPATLTITANNRSKTYGQAVTFAETEFITSGLVNSDTVTGASLNSAGALASALAAGSPYSIVASAATGTGLTNYSINYVNGSLTVNPALLLVRAESKSRAYGAANPVFTANISGFVNGESNNVLSGSPAFNTVADVNSPVGSYPIEITQGTLANGNYGFNFTNGNLTVTPYALTVTVNSTNRAYGDANPSLTGIVIGARDGDNITATFTTVANAASTVGTYGITPVISDPNGRLGNYSVTIIDNSLMVNPSALTITANNRSKNYGQIASLAGTDIICVGLKNSETVGVVSLTCLGSPATASVGSYSIVISSISGGTFNPDNYTLTYQNGAMTVIPAVLTVAADNKNRM